MPKRAAGVGTRWGRVLVAALLLFASWFHPGCSRRTAPAAELEPDERSLVDAYVRLALLQTLRAESPDSAAVLRRELAATLDTTAVRRAMASISRDPLRWELVYDAIAKRLVQLEDDPQLWWRAARGESLPASAPGPATDR